ncbi:MAG: HU family DNA-binding protein [Thermoplasmata archaeon]|jgi:nucleoid DNA-binding protein
MVGINEIARDVAKEAGVSVKSAETVIRKTFKKIVDEVNAKQKVRIAGFGIFSRKQTKARNAKNPRTKQIIKVPAKNKLHFSASSKVKYK